MWRQMLFYTPYAYWFMGTPQYRNMYSAKQKAPEKISGA